MSYPEISGAQKPDERPAPTHRHRTKGPVFDQPMTSNPLEPPGGPQGPIPAPSLVCPLEQLKLVVLRLQ